MRRQHTHTFDHEPVRHVDTAHEHVGGNDAINTDWPVLRDHLQREHAVTNFGKGSAEAWGITHNVLHATARPDPIETGQEAYIGALEEQVHQMRNLARDLRATGDTAVTGGVLQQHIGDSIVALLDAVPGGAK